VYAVYAIVKIDAAHIDTARSMLADQVVPSVKAQPGYVSGCWLTPVDGLGVSIVVFDTEANEFTKRRKRPAIFTLRFTQLRHGED